MSTLPLHPAIVHLPLGLAFVVPLLAIGLLLAHRRRALPRAAFAILVGAQALLVAGGVVAMQLGDRDAKRVEPVAGEAVVETHEERAEAFVWAVDLNTFAPAVNMPVNVYDQSGSLLASGNTDADGVFRGPITGTQDPYNSSFAMLGQPGEENFGFVFTESMACGLPIVTTDCGAIREVVGDGNFVNGEKDQKALFFSLVQLVREPKLRGKMGLANRHRAEKLFDMTKQIEKEEEVMRRRFC